MNKLIGGWAVGLLILLGFSIWWQDGVWAAVTWQLMGSVWVLGWGWWCNK
jgi:hypothetical protein